MGDRHTVRVSERVCLSYTPSHETVWMIGTQNHPCLCGVSEQPTRVERAPPGRLTGRTTLFFWVPSSIKMAAERSTVVWLSVEQTQWRLFTVMCTYRVLCAVLCCAVLCCAVHRVCRPLSCVPRPSATRMRQSMSQRSQPSRRWWAGCWMLVGELPSRKRSGHAWSRCSIPMRCT